MGVKDKLKSNKTLKKIYDGWMAFAKKLAAIQTAILLFITYFFVLGIIAIIRKIFVRKSHFFKPETSESFFYDREPEDQDIERYYRQF